MRRGTADIIVLIVLLTVVVCLNNRFSAIVFIFCLAVYQFAVMLIRGRRKITGCIYIKEQSPGTYPDLVFIVLLILLFSSIALWHLLMTRAEEWLAVVLTSVTINITGFFLLKNKTISWLVMSDDSIFINDLFLTSYRLEYLENISFNGLYESYYFRFQNGRTLVIKRKDYKDANMDQLIQDVLKLVDGRVTLSPSLRYLQ